MSLASQDLAVFELCFPLRAEFVSIARLTASGIANRAGFDIESIEDIKVSISEVCNRLITDITGDPGPCRISFTLDGDGLEMRFCVPGLADGWMAEGADGEGDVERSLGYSLIMLLMDGFEIRPEDKCVVMVKKRISQAVDT